ncbi:MAG: transketolase family protein [Candidatus Aquicultor sp.]|nr:transketolase family protein [Candidatus Aquicultor sp.]
MSEKRATREAYGETLIELGRVNPNIVVLEADLAKSTTTIKFKKEFPDRFFDCGVAEQNMMAMAAGLATTGKICFTGSFAMFATGRAFEQVRNTIAYPSLNVKICPTHAGITVGADGGSHQTIEDIALMRVIPGMTVIVPADYYEAKKAIAKAVEIDGPVYVRLGRATLPMIFDEDYDFVPGKAIVLREGTDVTIFATGIMVSSSLVAAESLAKDGISAEVINISTIKPLDDNAIIESAVKTGRVVVAEEHSIIGGLGSAVAELLCEKHPVPVARVGIKDVFGRSGEPAELLKYYGLTDEDISQAAKGLLGK